MKRNSKQSMEMQRQKAIRRLDVNNPRCGTCGEDEPLCLELHHIGGCTFDDTLSIICRNCHRILSAQQIEHPAQIGERKGLLERIGHFLLGMADLLGLAASKLREFGEALIAEARALCVSSRRAVS